MRKTLLISSIILLSILLFTPFTEASAGACSDHDGVNCAIGPDQDNSAICNDYWHDSTVNYWDLEECKYYLCPAQSALWEILVEKAESEGYLELGTSVCEQLGIPTTGVEGYTTLFECLDLQSDVNAQIYESIFVQVNDLRSACYYDVTEIQSSGCGLNSYEVNGKCSCYEGYIWASSDPTDLDCIAIETLFSDVSFDHSNYNAIKYLYDIGIIQGYPDGTFGPNNAVNRAELLKILIEGINVTPDANLYNTCFPDVNNEWFAPYVCYAKELNWVEGYPDGTFKPSQTVIKVEAIKMLLNSQNIEIPSSVTIAPYNDVLFGQWFTPFISKAKELGVLEEMGLNYYPADDMIRASISENLYRLLTM